MTIKSTKIAMGYQLSCKRPSCKNCFHGEERRSDDTGLVHATPIWHCLKGGFMTTAMATCNQHQPVMRGGAR